MSRRALEARLGRVAERMVGARGLRFPVGPVESWPEAELRRLARLVDADGAIRRAVWARLTDADLAWIVATWGDGAGAEEGAGRAPLV